MDFAIRLKQLRISKGLSQTELGAVLGLSKQAISNYESGVNTPVYSMFIRLADEFGVSLDYLSGRSDIASAIRPTGNRSDIEEEIANLVCLLTKDGKIEAKALVEAVLEKRAKYGRRKRK